MRTSFRRIVMAAATVIAVGAATAALPGTAEARWHGGGWHGGGWHGGWGRGGWGWGGFGWGFAPGFAIGVGAPYWGWGGPSYAYGGDCVLRRRWVINRWGHRVSRWTRVCF